MLEEEYELPFGDLSEEPTEEEIEDMRELEAGRKVVMHCKPTFEFQSVEFDFELDQDNLDLDLIEMFSLYDRIIKSLQAIAPEQSKKAPVKVSNEPLATPGQKATMDKFGIRYDANTTKKQAQALIQASIDGLGQ